MNNEAVEKAEVEWKEAKAAAEEASEAAWAAFEKAGGEKADDETLKAREKARAAAKENAEKWVALCEAKKAMKNSADE
jgi:hypothetical protein